MGPFSICWRWGLYCIDRQPTAASQTSHFIGQKRPLVAPSIRRHPPPPLIWESPKPCGRVDYPHPIPHPGEVGRGGPPPTPAQTFPCNPAPHPPVPRHSVQRGGPPSPGSTAAAAGDGGRWGGPQRDRLAAPRGGGRGEAAAVRRRRGPPRAAGHGPGWGRARAYRVSHPAAGGGGSGRG